jgi:peptidoglycan hydrolase-like protein with peptidoglycan-binding domain
MGREYRDAIYGEVIAAGNLKGNRSNPLQEKKFDSLSMSKMPAVLVEYGYMDSIVDAPVILTDEYSRKVAYATMDGIAKIAGLKKKATTSKYTQEQFVRDVQRACGAKVDGIAGPETLSKTVTLSASKNRRHAAVKPVQRWLMELGYTVVGEADGIAGTKFTAAVMAFQEANHCWQDGEITEKNKTWRKLLGME